MVGDQNMTKIIAINFNFCSCFFWNVCFEDGEQVSNHYLSVAVFFFSLLSFHFPMGVKLAITAPIAVYNI